MPRLVLVDTTIDADLINIAHTVQS
jgi:hypothetical protein